MISTKRNPFDSSIILIMDINKKNTLLEKLRLEND